MEAEFEGLRRKYHVEGRKEGRKEGREAPKKEGRNDDEKKRSRGELGDAEEKEW